MDLAFDDKSPKSVPSQRRDTEQALSVDSTPPSSVGSSDTFKALDLNALETNLEALISSHLPEFIEFKHMGYNLLFPMAADIEGLRARFKATSEPPLMAPLLQVLEPLQPPIDTFLTRFRQFRDEVSVPTDNLSIVTLKITLEKRGLGGNVEVKEMLKQANRLAGCLSGTLDLIDKLNDQPDHSSWQDAQHSTLFNLKNELFPLDADRHLGSYAANDARSKLGKDNPESIKFNRIVNSVMADQRTARDSLVESVKGQSNGLLMGIELTRKATASVRGHPSVAELAESVLAVCEPLRAAVKTLEAKGQSVLPSPTELPAKFKKPEPEPGLAQTLRGAGVNLKKYTAKFSASINRKSDALDDIYRSIAVKEQKILQRANQALSNFSIPEQNEALRKTDASIIEVGLNVLDSIQHAQVGLQTTLKSAHQLQQMLRRSDHLIEGLSEHKTHSVLDERLRIESARWRETAAQAREQLQQTLFTLTPLAVDTAKQDYVLRLKTILRQAPEVSKDITNTFYTHARGFVDILAGIDIELNKHTLALSTGDKADSKTLDEQMSRWSAQLVLIKTELKNRVIQATGRSINNFSRNGLLVRRIAELSESERKRFIAELSQDDQTEADSHFERLVFDVVGRQLPHLFKSSDPKSDYLLKRLRIELGNAEKDTLLYPDTMAELLAGMKSTSTAIQEWSRKRLVRTFVLTACLGTIKWGVNLSLLPLRTAIKFAITSAQVATVSGLGRSGGKGGKAVRSGHADVGDEKIEYAKRLFKKVSLKIMITIPPHVGHVNRFEGYRNGYLRAGGGRRSQETRQGISI